MRIAKRWGLLAMVLLGCRKGAPNSTEDAGTASTPVVRLPEGGDGSVAVPLESGGSLVASGTARWTLFGAKVTFGPDFPEEITRVRGSVADGFWFWGAAPNGHLWYAPSALAPAERVADGKAVTVGRFAIVAAGIAGGELRVFERGREIPSPIPAATTGIRLVTLTFGKPEVTKSYLVPTDGGAFRPSEFVLENGQLALKPVPDNERDPVGVALATHDRPAAAHDAALPGMPRETNRVVIHRFDDGSRLRIDERACAGCIDGTVDAVQRPYLVAAGGDVGRPLSERGVPVGTNLYDCALLSDHGPTAHLLCAVGKEPLRQSIRVTASGKVTMEQKFASDQRAPFPGSPVLAGACDPDGEGKVQDLQAAVCVFEAKKGRWQTYTYPKAGLLGAFPGDGTEPFIVTSPNKNVRVARGNAEIAQVFSTPDGDVLAVNADGTLFTRAFRKQIPQMLAVERDLDLERGPLTATSPSTTTLLPNVPPTDVGMAGREIAVHRSIDGAEVLVIGHLREDSPAIAWTGTIPLHRATGPSAVACDRDGCELGPFRYPWSTARPLTAAPADGKIPGSAIPPVAPVAEELARFANFRCTAGTPTSRAYKYEEGILHHPPTEKGELSFSVFDAGRTAPFPRDEGLLRTLPVVSNLPRAYARVGGRYRPTMLYVGSRTATVNEEIGREIDHIGPGGEIPAPGTSIAVNAKSGAVLKPRLLRPIGAPATALTPYRFEGPVEKVPQVLATTLEIDGQGRCTAIADDDVRFIPGPEAWDPAFGRGRQRLLVRGNATRLCLEALEMSEKSDDPNRQGRQATVRFSDPGKAPYGSLVDTYSVFPVTCAAK